MKYDGKIVFYNGSFVKYEDVNIGLLNHAFLYGTGCFEALRGYRSLKGEEIRLLGAIPHYQRLHHSARILGMKLAYKVDELVSITRSLIERNAYDCDIYVRATVYKSSHQLGVGLHNLEDALAIVAVPYSGYYGTTTTLRAGVSSWKRVDDNAAPARAKITGIYVDSALAKSSAVEAGFDEAITLAEDGHVAEASAANIFIRRGDELATPAITGNILEGITRRMVLEYLGKNSGLRVIERQIDRSELYVADEIFITGTAVGVMPIVSVDHRIVGDGTTGDVTARLRQIFDADLRGERSVLSDYLTAVSVKRAASCT